MEDPDYYKNEVARLRAENEELKNKLATSEKQAAFFLDVNKELFAIAKTLILHGRESQVRRRMLENLRVCEATFR